MASVIHYNDIVGGSRYWRVTVDSPRVHLPSKPLPHLTLAQTSGIWNSGGAVVTAPWYRLTGMAL